MGIQQAWNARDGAAKRRLLSASVDFVGMYPSGGAAAFAEALACLSPETPDARCSLAIMEAAFKELDSELVRLECSLAQQDVIDDLWRLIKMLHNGATRQEAIAAKRPEETSDVAAQS